jgi:hypothetical protein
MQRRESPEIEALKANAAATLSDEVKEVLRKMNNFEYQDENGVDLTLIYSQLHLTPTERVRRMDAYAHSMRETRKHVRRIA